jgi:hypothetical protein
MAATEVPTGSGLAEAIAFARQKAADADLFARHLELVRQLEPLIRQLEAIAPLAKAVKADRTVACVAAEEMAGHDAWLATEENAFYERFIDNTGLGWCEQRLTVLADAIGGERREV